MKTELAKTLTTALVQFIDRERPEGAMCCSNCECEKIEKAFVDDRLDIVDGFIQRKLMGLTEFELFLFNAVLDNNFVGGKGSENALEMTKKIAPELLALAKKQLLSYADESNPAIEAMADLERTYFCNPDKLPKWLKDDIARKELNAHTKGYNKGYKDAEEFYNKTTPSLFPTVAIRPLCWEPGGTCTNPHMDCINCPRKTTGGGFNTASGTSTATLHGNTSATDGKEHNPSFTD